MGAPTLEGEITTKIFETVKEFFFSRVDYKLAQEKIGKVIAEYFDGDVFLIEDVPIGGEGKQAYEARMAQLELKQKAARWDAEENERRKKAFESDPRLQGVIFETTMPVEQPDPGQQRIRAALEKAEDMIAETKKKAREEKDDGDL